MAHDFFAKIRSFFEKLRRRRKDEYGVPVRNKKRKRYAVSLIEVTPLLRLYGQEAAEKLSYVAQDLPESAAFSEDLADAINRIEHHSKLIVRSDLTWMAFGGWDSSVEVDERHYDRIMARINESLRAERANLIAQRAMKGSAQPPDGPSRPKTREEWLDRCMGHTKTKNHSVQAKQMGLTRTVYFDLKNLGKASDETRAKAAAYITRVFMPCDPEDLR